MAANEHAPIEIHLQPGEVHLARSPVILKTILGSCVGVTFWSPRLALGALCHGVLPRCPHGLQAPAGYRYVDFAIRDVVRQMQNLGAFPREIEVKLFGGADVLPVDTSRSRATVGQQNCRAAVEIVREQGLRVAATDMGGTLGRLIQFHTGTGEVLLRRLSATACEEAQAP